MLLRLGGTCRSLALQFCTVAAPMFRQRSHAATICRSYMMRAPTVPSLQRSSSLLLRCGVHTSSSLHKRRKMAEDEEFREMMQSYRQELKKMPRPAVYISLVGLLPVVVAPVSMSIGGYYYPEMAFLQLVAANCLLSFYGGIRWGISVPENSPLRPDSLNLMLGAFLPLIAWLSLISSDSFSTSAVMLIGGMFLGIFGGVGLLPPYPLWLGVLRSASFLVTIFSILVTLVLSDVYPEKSLKDESPK